MKTKRNGICILMSTFVKKNDRKLSGCQDEKSEFV